MDDRLGPAAVTLAGVMARVAGWRPDEFWAATPADVRAALAGWGEADADAPLGGAALAAMMERFPDG
ncbi:phage tail assembly chaperone [Sphingopyxis fribergensis]